MIEKWLERRRRTHGIGQEADGAVRPENTGPERLLAGKRGRFFPCPGRDRRKPGIRRQPELFRSVAEQRGRDQQIVRATEKGQCR